MLWQKPRFALIVKPGIAKPRLWDIFEFNLELISPYGIRDPGKFAWEFGILGFGIRNIAQGIRNPSDDWNLQSKFLWQRLESSTWIRDSDCLGYHYTRQLYPAYETVAHKIGPAKGWFMLCEKMAVYFD